MHDNNCKQESCSLIGWELQHVCFGWKSNLSKQQWHCWAQWDQCCKNDALVVHKRKKMLNVQPRPPWLITVSWQSNFHHLWTQMWLCLLLICHQSCQTNMFIMSLRKSRWLRCAMCSFTTECKCQWHWQMLSVSEFDFNFVCFISTNSCSECQQWFPFLSVCENAFLSCNVKRKRHGQNELFFNIGPMLQVWRMSILCDVFQVWADCSLSFFFVFAASDDKSCSSAAARTHSQFEIDRMCFFCLHAHGSSRDKVSFSCTGGCRRNMSPVDFAMP